MSLQPPKDYYPTFEITENDDGIRPAGKPDECFFCNRKVGEQHEQGCVITWRRKKVQLVAHVRFEEEVPEHYTAEDIDYRYNKGTWCALNLWERFGDESCGCDAVEKVELIKEEAA